MLVRDLLTEPKFVQEAQHELPVLKYVLRVNVLDSVVGRVDVRVTVLKRSLKDERSREAVPRSGTVVRAGIAADTVHALNVRVLRYC